MNSILNISGLTTLWEKTKGTSDIRIAILDGSIDIEHPCFQGAQIELAPTIAKDNLTNDMPSQHGTHVASIILGQHHSAIQGIAPLCQGLIIPIYPSNNDDKRICSQLDLARAINQAIAYGAHIINISGGELGVYGSADPILAKAIQQCVDSDILVVAAAGNNGCRCLHVPASISSVLAVGAMNAEGNPVSFSNWGDAYHHNGILALGIEIPGAEAKGDIVHASGTSFAAPIVSGVAALLLSLQIKSGMEPSPHAIRKILLETVAPCNQTKENCQHHLSGKLDIQSALTRLATLHKGMAGLSLNKPINTFYPASEGGGAGINNLLALPTQPNQHILQPTLNHLMRSSIVTDINAIPTDIAEAHNSGIQPAEFADMPSELESNINSVQPSAVAASDCGCNKTKASPTIAYVLGQIGVDFGTEAKRDAFIQLSGVNIYNATELLEYLKSDPASAANIIWTLSLDATVVYAIQPYGPFATHTYDRLKEFLEAQADEDVERVSIPGLISGSTRLMNGQEVPVLYPDLRGMYSWSTQDLITASIGEAPTEKAAALLHTQRIDGINNFLERIYYEVRNLGTSPQERAINFAATNAFQISAVFENAIKTNMKLEDISVERSPICRPGSDCWDVKLSFFNPAKRLEQARHVYRFTVDVSEVIPVSVGKIRNWDIY